MPVISLYGSSNRVCTIGFVQTFVCGDLYRYDVEKEWKLVLRPNSPPPRSAHQAVAWKNYLYIFGGEFTSPNQEQFHHYKDFWSLDLNTNSWEQLNYKGCPSPRSGHRMTSCPTKSESETMGKRGSHKKAPNITSGSHSSITLREESSGKRQTNVNAKSMLKLEHVSNLTVWAGGEASIPSLGAFFGHRLAALGESLGTPPDPSLFPCQRCESILQPGYNCTVRIEKNAAKARRRRKRPNISTQNNVVYKCHCCLHRNLKRGTPRGYVKELCPPKAKPSLKLDPTPSIDLKSVKSEECAMTNTEVKKMDAIASPAKTIDDSVADCPATPSVRTCTTLLEAKRRTRNRSGSKKVAESGINSPTLGAEKSVTTSNKRKRKSWTSLKEIAESSDRSNNRNLTNLTIPFLI